MKEAFALIGELIEEIEAGIKQGVSEDEILDRLRKPGGVGYKLIAAMKNRGNKLDDFIANG